MVAVVQQGPAKVVVGAVVVVVQQTLLMPLFLVPVKLLPLLLQWQPWRRLVRQLGRRGVCDLLAMLKGRGGGRLVAEGPAATNGAAAAKMQRPRVNKVAWDVPAMEHALQ